MRRRALAFAALLAVLALGTAAAAQGPARVRLPTPRDAIAAVPGADEILLGAGFEERRFPGRVSDVEIVDVAMGVDGAPAAVRVTQRLTLTGVGDFSFRIPGPVRSIEPLPEAGSRPGLRRGSVIWQGFSPGERVLAARMELDPALESARLPLRITLDLRVAGRPVAPGVAASGPLELRMTIENRTAIPSRVADADADRGEVADALDAIRARLLAGRRPLPGRHGVPGAVAAVGAVRYRTAPIEAPIMTGGNVDFAPGTIEDLAATGATVNAAGTGVSFRRLLGGGRPLAHEVRLTGVARDLLLPGLVVAAYPAPPVAAVVQPPAGARSWAEALAAGTAPDGRTMLATAMDALWRTARLRLYDAYLGSPDPAGFAGTTYSYALNPPQAAVPPAAPPAPRTFGAWGAALTAIAVAALLFAAGLQWAHA